ncbi:ORF228 [White spot syndrome virus]|uniref:Wsv175 n=3 Tax=White spot syndrome virus TaxID=342409 RepID=Q8VB25_WSSVS|nr:wsv175 [Shrimp white spot syndrome virus]AFX59553.1 wsv175 [White spot syndrome virus]AAL33179.1 wsv175 [Shrimp white spot syndrome virus]AAL89099.1 WSSV231 [Shrimp white spot syndrome virus]ATU83954.1 ORF228 [White spot syndrome virus]AWQ60353.1 wsv175 [Shrimp white spot syndrome virus]
MKVDAESSSSLGDDCRLLKSIINTLNAIILKAQKEARGKLGCDCSTIKQCGGSMGKIVPRHEIICFNDRFDV